MLVSLSEPILQTEGIAGFHAAKLLGLIGTLRVAAGLSFHAERDLTK